MNQEKWISWVVRLGSVSLVAGMVSYLAFTHHSESTTVSSQEQADIDQPTQSDERNYSSSDHHRDAFGSHVNRQSQENRFNQGSDGQYSDRQFPGGNEGFEQHDGYDTTTRGT
ncbi:hypothetical protein [Bacillus sp. 165]|uniref:hypothetical protein n=1 Tax=Bacillus sp. 165 TaxID=1529117 RepID=UPI001ADCB8FB|nr:hypothetical protein [Bacillus sp. 165]MBO9129401.1 hypothetical protein [Bacillus sp. 165]